MQLNTYSSLIELINENIPKMIQESRFNLTKQILYMIEKAISENPDILEEDLAVAVQSIEIEHTSSTPEDDDQYLHIKNPFTETWWKYATNPSCEFPVKPNC